MPIIPLPPQAPVSDVCFRLEAMEMRDQEVRNRAVSQMQNGKLGPAIAAEMNRIDREDTAELKKIVAQYGWPTISKFGRQCSNWAWLLVQHADLDHAWQQHCLDLMKPLVPKKEISAQNYAYLADRLSVAKTGKQLYGTQAKIESGQIVLRPVIDRKNLDARRKAVGMMPIAEYLKIMREEYLPHKK